MKTNLVEKIVRILFVFIFVLGMVWVPGTSAGASGPLCYVDVDAGGANDGTLWADAYTDLQSALSDSGCTEIWVAAGIYNPTSGTDRTISFVLKNGVGIYGGFAGTETLLEERDWAANETILSGDLNGDDVGFDNNGENSYHVVNGGGTDGSAILDGFIIRAGNANGEGPDQNGGGMYNYDTNSPTLSNLIFSGNAAGQGGGMFNFHSSLTLTNATFSTNTAGAGGGIINFLSNPALTNVTFSSNTASDSGGGLYNDASSPALTNVTFHTNSANSGGGLRNDNGSNPTLTNVTFTGNTATSLGGGMLNGNSGSTMMDVTFTSNSAAYGGGMYNHQSSPTLTGVTFSSNTASDSGGGMYNDASSPSLMNVTFNGNSTSAGSGGAIYSESGSISLVDSLVVNNVANGVGGGISTGWGGSGSIQITGSTIRGNSAAQGGGGITSTTSLTITESVLADNTTPSQGGAISGGGVMTITNSTISGNSAGWIGGGISNGEGAIININYTTITNNVADSDYNGDGFGGGIRNYLGTVNLKNSILAGNITRNGFAPDCGGEMVSQDYNLIQSLNGCTVTAGAHDIIGQDAGLGPLDDNGGPTQTHALLRGSPAIEAANPADCPGTDQRGVARPQETRCEIGAFELVIQGNAQPTADAGGPYTVFIGNIVTLDASASSDPDGDALTYDWDLDNDDQYNDATGVTTTTVFNQAGEYTVGLRVTDTFGLNSTDTATVNAGVAVPPPGFGVRANDDEIEGWWWPQGATVTVTIEDPTTPQSPDYAGTAVVNIEFPEGDHRFGLRTGSEFDIVPGQVVTVTDGTTTNQTTVTGLAVTGIDVDTDVVSGIAGAGSQVDLWICAATECASRHVSADSNGNWSADFSVPGTGSDPSEQVLYDIVPGTHGDSAQWDMDGDGGGTSYFWHALNPVISVHPDDDWLEGYDWPAGVTVNISIDNPATTETPDLTRSAVVGTSSWNPSENYFSLDLRNTYDIKAGFLVSVSDGQITKDHEVTNLVVANADATADTVSGTANPNVHLRVDVFDTNGVGMEIDSDSNGNWTADFTGQYDLKPGTSGRVQESDSDWDNTGDDWQVPNPTFSARLTENEVHGYEWPLGASVTLTINDPNTPQPVDYTDTQTVIVADWDPNQTFVPFRLWENAFSLKPGMTVTMSEGQITKSHVVTNLTVTVVDPVADTVSGTAAPGSLVEVGHIYCDDTGCYGFRRIIADGNGDWVADFSQVGEDEDEQDIIDILPGTGSEARQPDEDGDTTNVQWGVPNPRMDAWFRDGNINAYEWPLGTHLTLDIEDPTTPASPDYSTTTEVGIAPWNPNETLGEFQLNGAFEIQPGMTLTVSGASSTKELLVSNLTITNIDQDTDIITGGTEPNQSMWMWFDSPSGICCRDFQADGDGLWMVDYSQPGPNGEPVEDIRPGSSGTVNARDEDGDNTSLIWNVLNPFVEAAPYSGWIHARDWPLGTLITLEIDDPSDGTGDVDYTATDTVHQAPWNPGDPNDILADFSWPSQFAPGPGYIITASGNGQSKTLTVTQLRITGFDLLADTVSGIGTVGAQIQVCANVTNRCITRYVTPDGSGNWTANYAEAGVSPDDPDTFDVQLGSNGWAAEYEADSDRTWADWNVPNPSLGVRANTDSVEGWQWPLGVTVTVTVDDPGSVPSPDVTKTAVVYEAPWNPGEYRFDIDLNGEFDIQPGNVVTASDGVTTKTHTVTAHVFTDIDIDTDTVTGRAEAGTRVDVWACDASSCINRHVNANGTGIWIADFAHPGVEGDEQNTFDITYGTWVDSSQSDEDGDSTMFGQNVPNYTLHAVPTHPEVHGHDWPLNANVTLTIDNDTDPNNGILYTQTRNVSDDPWCGEPCFDLQGVFTLEVGQYATMTDGNVTKTVHVSVMKITEVNREADTISGIADPGSRVGVNIGSQDSLARYVTTDTNGNWVADFSVFGDEDFEQFTTDLTYGDNGRAIQLNPDGTDDGTLEYWSIDWIAPDTVPLVAAIPSDVDLNRPSYTVESWTLLNLLYEPFFRLTENGTLIPAAAVDYTLSPDSLVYTITLRDGMQWSDGQPVTAQHYVDGLLRILAPDTTTDYTYLLFDIQGAEEYNNGSITDPNLVGITALNNNTLQITLARPAVYYPAILATGGFIPARLDLITGHGDAWVEPANFAGNGPYTLLEHDGGHFLLQKNPYYYDAAGVSFEQIGLDIISDENERLEAYKRGEVDVLIDASSAALNDANYDSERVYSDAPGVSYIGLNVQRAPTDNPLVRKALAAATNRRAILDTVLNTPWRQEATGVISPELPGYQGNAVGYEYNPTLAQDLLAQAGYPGGVGLPTIHLYGPPAQQPVLDAIADQWRTVLGISVETHYRSDFGTWIGGCVGDPSLCEYNGYRLGWLIDYFDTHNIINDAFNPISSTIVRTGWDNARYRELIDLSRGEQNQTQRIAYFEEADQILVEDDAVLIPIFFYDRVSLVKPGFSTAFGLIPYFEQWGLVACYTLTTDVNPAGSGIITADPMPNCPTDATKYQAGTAVTLTATPSTNWTFSGWSGGGCSGTGTCMVAVNADTSVTANFDLTSIPVIFADSFESGNFSMWSACITDVNDLSVSAAAKMVGNYGMQALLDDNVAIYCTDDTPSAETRYLASFYFDPNTITMVNGDTHTIFGGYAGTSTLVLRLQFRRSAGLYQVQAAILSDGTAWKTSTWTTISDAPHQIKLDWRAATAAGANDGRLMLWIDDVQKADLTAVDNDTRRIDRARLGAVAAIDTGTRGTYFFDEFESSRGDAGPAPTFTLTVNKTGTGSGTVTSSPAGIDCGSDCSESYPSGTAVTLTATATAGSTFTGWSGGDCSGTGACVVTLTADTSVTANFDVQASSNTLTVGKTGTGSGTVTSSPTGIDCGLTCSYAFAYNTVVTLTATATAGSTFTGWSGGGCSGTAACTVTITADTSVTANFDLTSSPDNLLGNPSFEVDANNDNKPDVWSTNAKFTRSTAIPALDGSYIGRFYATDNSGATIQQVVPNLTAGETYNFSGWVNIPSTSDTFTFKIQVKWRNASNSAISTKVIKTYTTSTGGWNEATASLVAPAGTTNALVQMIVSSLNGTIYVDDFSFGGSAGPSTYTLTVNKTGTGTGSVTSSPAGINCGLTCSSVFNTNTVVTLTATATAGSTFTGWSGGGCSGTGTCVVTLTADTSVTANFNLQSSSHVLTVNKTGTGSGTVTSSPAGIDCGLDCLESYASGTVVTLTATAASGSTFTGWSGGGCSGTSTCAVTLTADTSVTANFDLTSPTDIIFADGFESGNFSNWSACVTDVNDLSVSVGAKSIGNYGMQALLDDNAAIYCTSDHPNAETRYRARFYFDPNSIAMASGDAHFIFNGFMGTSTAVMRVEFRYFSGTYQVRARLLDDGSTWTNTNWFMISDAAHFIELDWQASTALGANDGGLAFWIDGVPQVNLTGVDNDTRRIDRVRLGAVTGIDTGTRGTYFFDSFESRRLNYIGP